jgi:hypothetical protein
MDFRNEACAWCPQRTGPQDDCQICPRYEHRSRLTADQLCPACRNHGSIELEVFCRTNRRYQEDSGEDFECYKFVLERGLA